MIIRLEIRFEKKWPVHTCRLFSKNIKNRFGPLEPVWNWFCHSKYLVICQSGVLTKKWIMAATHSSNLKITITHIKEVRSFTTDWGLLWSKLLLCTHNLINLPICHVHKKASSEYGVKVMPKGGYEIVQGKISSNPPEQILWVENWGYCLLASHHILIVPVLSNSITWLHIPQTTTTMILLSNTILSIVFPPFPRCHLITTRMHPVH